MSIRHVGQTIVLSFLPSEHKAAYKFSPTLLFFQCRHILRNYPVFGKGMGYPTPFRLLMSGFQCLCYPELQQIHRSIDPKRAAVKAELVNRPPGAYLCSESSFLRPGN